MSSGEAAPPAGAAQGWRTGGSAPPVRVVVADDHPVVREGLKGMLAGDPGVEVVGEAADGREAVELAARLRPDVVLMDLRMPVMDGVEATRLISGTAGPARGPHQGGTGPPPAVIVVTTYDTDHDILKAIEAGARGYLLKDSSPADILRAVRAAAGGGNVLAPTVAAKLVDRARSAPAAELTKRELDIVALVATGRSNAEIGEALFIGEATVKSHLLHAFAKLGVSDRTAAVTTAIARGLVAAPGESPQA